MERLTRTTQVEFQHISYAVAKIRSYNPIQDCEYSTIREQGLLFFVPIVNELGLNLAEKTLNFAFYRPSNLTTGVSLMNRVRNTPSTNYLIPNVIIKKKIKSVSWDLEDIGLNLSMSIQQDYAQENVEFMMESDILRNTR